MRPLEKRDKGKPLSLVVKYRLPSIPESGNFLISDYEKYELEREGLFDSPVGRVAGRSGGSRFDERVNYINNGPSEEALRTGVKVFCGPNDDSAIICGQYLARIM